ncbi:MAG: hypothetical protein H0V18_19370 [Pyrinomonadaceae bacterium]|nr:hypothetical protein [Pyrinomonadaceae bacterium]
MNKQEMEWCDIKVIVDDATTDLFEMPEPDEDPEQEPAFRVTRSTAELVDQDFERYRSSLERMADDWREEKKRFIQENKDDAQSGADLT